MEIKLSNTYKVLVHEEDQVVSIVQTTESRGYVKVCVHSANVETLFALMEKADGCSHQENRSPIPEEG